MQQHALTSMSSLQCFISNLVQLEPRMCYQLQTACGQGSCTKVLRKEKLRSGCYDRWNTAALQQQYHCIVLDDLTSLQIILLDVSGKQIAGAAVMYIHGPVVGHSRGSLQSLRHNRARG
jgi:hypothetical protein